MAIWPQGLGLYPTPKGGDVYMSVCDREHKQVSKPIERIEISIKPLSKEKVKQIIESQGYDIIFKEIEEYGAFGDLVSRIAKLLVAYREDPRIALDFAIELVFDWATEKLYSDVKDAIAGSVIGGPLYEITFNLGRDDLRDELRRKGLY